VAAVPINPLQLTSIIGKVPAVLRIARLCDSVQ
jgi:hypothetical protein